MCNLWHRLFLTLWFVLTLLRISSVVGRSSLDDEASTDGTYGELGGDRQYPESLNDTYLDNNDFGYVLRAKLEKSDKNGEISEDGDGKEDPNVGSILLPVSEQECKLPQPTIPNGFVKGDMVMESDYRWVVKYGCNSGYTDGEHGLIRCNNMKWEPSPDSVCRRLCPPLSSRRLNELESLNGERNAGKGTSAILEPVNGQSFDPTGEAARGTRLRFRCPAAVSRPKYKADQLECGGDGEWTLLDPYRPSGRGVTVQTVDDLCESINTDFAKDVCRRLIPRTGLKIRYKFTQAETGLILTGDEAVVTCKKPNFAMKSQGQSSQAVFRCMSNGRWRNQEELASLRCVAVGCEHPISNDQLTPVFETQSESDLEFRPQLLDGNSVSFGSRVFYTCNDLEHYYLVGDREYTCDTNGTWTPPYWPRCQKKKRCTAVDFPTEGDPDQNSNGETFEPGHLVNFVCTDGYRLEGKPSIKCLESGEWNFRPPTCVRDQWSTKRFIAVSSAACLLGLLLVVVVGFFVQRQLLLRKALNAGRRHRLLDSGGSGGRLRFPSVASITGGAARGTSAGRTGPAAFDSDPDRLALIAYADGAQVPLPSYEEAVNEHRCHPPPFDAISTLSGYYSRAVRRLPSLSSLRSSRGDGSTGSGVSRSPRERQSELRCGGNGRRLQAEWSITSGSNVHHNCQVGSNDTMAVSDISTNITLETVSSGGRSHSASARAYAGSLSSVHSSAVSTSAVPLMALSVCSASSVASSDGTSSAPVPALLDVSDTEGLPLLESQEQELNQENVDEEDASSQLAPTVDSSDEICSQKSVDA